MSRVIIDVTQLVRWQGKLTGIPRVMHELSIRFEKYGNTLFIEWDTAHQAYIEVNLGAALKKREAQEELRSAAPQKVGRGRIASKLIHVAKRAKSKSTLTRKLLFYPERVARKLFTSPDPVAMTPEVSPVALQKDDTLLVLWGDWHDQSFIDHLLILKCQGIRLAQVAYDMLPLVTPQYSGHSTEWLDNYARSIYPACDVIVSISEHTKKDVANWLRNQGLHVPMIEVIRLGDDFKFAKPKKPDHRFFNKRQDYVLCVGTIEARKNHTLLYYVYKLAKHRGITLHPIIVVGRRGWRTDDIYELMTTDPDTKEAIVFLQNANDEELSWLYENCAYSIYPSFYEGWGLPIAESVARGVPCIASNTSSMPEIAGDLIDYFDPASTDECLGALQKMLSKTRRDKLARNLTQYKPKSWDETFTQVNKIIGGLND